MLSYSPMLLMCLSLVLRVLAMILSSPQTTKEGVWPWPPESLSHNADLYSICASLSLVLQNLTSMLMYDSLTTPQALPCSQSSNQYLLTIQLSQPSLTLRLTCRETNRIHPVARKSNSMSTNMFRPKSHHDILRLLNSSAWSFPNSKQSLGRVPFMDLWGSADMAVGYFLDFCSLVKEERIC